MDRIDGEDCFEQLAVINADGKIAYLNGRVSAFGLDYFSDKLIAPGNQMQSFHFAQNLTIVSWRSAICASSAMAITCASATGADVFIT